MHDLVRAYAREQAGAETEPALRRVLDFYLRSAYAADLTGNPTRRPISLPPEIAGVHSRGFADIAEATQWLADEDRNLLAAQDEAMSHGWHELTWQLAWAVAFHRICTGRLLDNVTSCRVGLAAALCLGDPAVEAQARQLLGTACKHAELSDEANAQLTESIRIAAEIGDVVTEFFSENHIGDFHIGEGRVDQANEHARRALALAEKTGNQQWLAGALMNLAWALANQGDYEDAESYGARSLELRLRYSAEDHVGMGNLLDCLGFTVNGMGRYDEAISYYQSALAEYAINKTVYGDAETFEHLGHPYRSLGRLDEAREAWQQALDLCRQQNRPTDVERIQGLLDELSALAFE